MRRRWILRIAAGLGALLLVGVVVGISTMPAVAAYVCPTCYGFTAVGDDIYVEYVEDGTGAADIAATRAMVAAARDRVGAFYGRFDRQPRLLICASEACDARLGGGGGKARTYGSVFIHVSPDGRDATILAHEFSHIELHARVGALRLVAGAVPAWFDEGVAVIVSRDPRYLDVDSGGTLQCRVEPDGALPTDRDQWRSEAGQGDRPIYAMAACQVLRWMDDHGGRQGVLAALEAIHDGASLGD